MGTACNAVARWDPRTEKGHHIRMKEIQIKYGLQLKMMY
jgi:hypothetical protein